MVGVRMLLAVTYPHEWNLYGMLFVICRKRLSLTQKVSFLLKLGLEIGN